MLHDDAVEITCTEHDNQMLLQLRTRISQLLY